MSCMVCQWYVRWNASCQSSPLGIMYVIRWRGTPKSLHPLWSCVESISMSTSKSKRSFVSRRASDVSAVRRSKGRKRRVESRGVRKWVGVGGGFVWEGTLGYDHDDEDDQIVFLWFFLCCPWLRLNKLRRNGSMQSVRERPSDPWIGMIGWAGLGFWSWIRRALDCGWLEGWSRATWRGSDRRAEASETSTSSSCPSFFPLIFLS